MPDPSSWDLLDEDFSDITDWTDADNDGESTEDPEGQLKLTVATAGAGRYARRTRDWGSLPNTFTAEIRVYHDTLGARGDSDHFSFFVAQADEGFFVVFGTGGIEIFDTDSGYTEVGTDLVKSGGSAEWQVWRFVVTFTGTTGEGTCDVYLADSTHTFSKVGTSIPCSFETSSYDNGFTWLDQQGQTTSGVTTHVDYAKIATGSYPGTVDLVAAIASGATLASDVVLSRKFVAALSSATTLQAALNRARKLVAALSADSSVSSDVALARRLVAAITSEATLSSALGLAKRLVAAISSDASLSAIIELAIKRLRATIASESTLGADLVLARKLAAQIAVESGLTAALAKLVGLGAAIDSETALTVDLKRGRGLSVAIDSETALTVDLKRGRGLSVAIDAEAELTAALIRAIGLATTISVDSSLSSILKLARKVSVSIGSASTLSGNLVLSLSLSASLSADVDLSAILGRAVHFACSIQSSATLTASLLEYIITEMIYSGDLEAGDVLVIDTRRDQMTVYLNDANARPDFNGKFAQLLPGDNEVIVEDADSSRSLQLKVFKEDRYA